MLLTSQTLWYSLEYKFSNLSNCFVGIAASWKHPLWLPPLLACVWVWSSLKRLTELQPTTQRNQTCPHNQHSSHLTLYNHVSLCSGAYWDVLTDLCITFAIPSMPPSLAASTEPHHAHCFKWLGGDQKVIRQTASCSECQTLPQMRYNEMIAVMGSLRD